MPTQSDKKFNERRFNAMQRSEAITQLVASYEAEVAQLQENYALVLEESEEKEKGKQGNLSVEAVSAARQESDASVENAAVEMQESFFVATFIFATKLADHYYPNWKPVDPMMRVTAALAKHNSLNKVDELLKDGAVSKDAADKLCESIEVTYSEAGLKKSVDKINDCLGRGEQGVDDLMNYVDSAAKNLSSDMVDALRKGGFDYSQEGRQALRERVAKSDPNNLSELKLRLQGVVTDRRMAGNMYQALGKTMSVTQLTEVFSSLHFVRKDAEAACTSGADIMIHSKQLPGDLPAWVVESQARVAAASGMPHGMRPKPSQGRDRDEESDHTNSFSR